jgi:hypothetical protein
MEFPAKAGQAMNAPRFPRWKEIEERDSRIHLKMNVDEQTNQRKIVRNQPIQHSTLTFSLR